MLRGEFVRRRWRCLGFGLLRPSLKKTLLPYALLWTAPPLFSLFGDKWARFGPIAVVVSSVNWTWQLITHFSLFSFVSLCLSSFSLFFFVFLSFLCFHLATPLAWYKCQNSQNAQKCLRRVLKVIWGLWAESPKRVSRTVQALFRTGRNIPKHSFALCKRLFWDSHSGGPKTPFALSLKHFWAFWLFRHLYQASRVASLVLNSMWNDEAHSWETDFQPLLVLTRRGHSTGKNQYW